MSNIPMYKLNTKTMPIQKTISKKRRSEDDEDSVASGAIGMDLSKLFDFGGKGTSGISKSKNHIYFYDDVSTETCLELNRTLIDMAKDLQPHSLEYDTKPAKIYLHINSNGGE